MFIANFISKRQNVRRNPVLGDAAEDSVTLLSKEIVRRALDCPQRIRANKKPSRDPREGSLKFC